MPAKKNKKLLELGLRKFLDGSPIGTAAEIADAGPRTIYRAKERVKKYGAVYAPKPENEGRPRELDPHMMEWLLQLLEGKPDMYLDEMRDELEEVYDRKFSLPTISRRLKEAKWSKIDAVKAAKQRNLMQRERHQHQMRELRRNQLVYVDESAANEKVGDRKRIWSFREPKASSAAATATAATAAAAASGSSPSKSAGVDTGMAEPMPFNKGEKYAILPAFTIKGFLCHDIVEGSFDAEAFYVFLRDSLLPLCNPFPGENSVIIMDDASIHRSPEVRELIEASGCKLIYLPPCSPDYNPIEYAFIYVKKWIALHTIEFRKASEGGYLPQFFEAAMQAVDNRACDVFFRKCGVVSP